VTDKHPVQRVEAACAKAIAVGDPSYRTIKGILTAGTETDPPGTSAGDAGAPAFLHGPSRLFANVIPMPSPRHPHPKDMPTGDGDPAGPAHQAATTATQEATA
jgi:hypothetical protein